MSAFNLGQLARDDALAVEHHIDDCQTCCETLLGLASEDTFVALLREADRQRNLPAEGNSTSGGIPVPLVEHPRYEIVRTIGRGGMGEVYEARHLMMDRRVALKVIKSEFVERPEIVERFRREVRTAALLSHENIVTAHDADQAGDLHFLVMEYVDGTDLARVVKKRGPLPVEEACDYARQAATGLAEAHRRGLVHRDVKPHNLMVTPEGTVKILDFGLAALVPHEAFDSDTAEVRSGLTSHGGVMGTPDFISPEQVGDARNADARSDVYSLGATLFFLLTGRPLFDERDVARKLRSHCEVEPSSLESLRSDMPVGLAGLVERMVAKDPDERFRTAAEVAGALQAYAGSGGLRPASREPRQGRSFQWVAIALGFALLVVAGSRYLGSGAGIEPVDDTADRAANDTVDVQTVTVNGPDRPSFRGRVSLPVLFPDSAPRFVDDTLARDLDRIGLQLEGDRSAEAMRAAQELLDGLSGSGSSARGVRSFSDEVDELDRGPRGSAYARYGSLRADLERLQRSADAESRRQHALETDVEAERLWQEFRRNGNVPTLQSLVARHFNGTRGDDAAVALASLALDRGDPVEAYSLLDRVRTEHPDPDVDAGMLRIRTVVAAARLGDLDAARAEWERLEEDGLAAAVPARVREEIDRALAGELRPDVDRRALPAISATALGDRVTESWTLPLDDVESQRFDTDVVLPQWTKWGRSPVSRVAASNGRVYVRGRHGILCSDSETGRTLWSGRRSASPDELVSRRYGEKRAELQLEPRMRSVEQTAWFLDRVPAEFTVDADRVFVVERTDDLGEATGSSDVTTSRRVRPNVLAAYDAGNGRPLWSLRAAEPDADREAVAGFLGAPAAVDDDVLVAASFDGDVWLLALDRETGVTRWRTFVCDEPSGGASLWSPARVVVAGSAVYVLPGTGLVACLNAATGDPRWAVRYQRSSRLTKSREQRREVEPAFDFFGWEQDTLLVAGRRLIVAPSDSKRLFALDRRDGSLEWEAESERSEESPRPTMVLGASDDHVVVAGPDVLLAHRLSDGGTAWETPIAGGTGRGLVTADSILVPVGEALAEFDPRTGESRRSSVFVSGYGKPLGNLATDGERVYAAGATRALALAPLDAHLESLAARIEDGDARARLDRSLLMIRLERQDQAIDELIASAATIRDATRDTRTASRVLEQLGQPAYVERDPGRVLRALASTGLAEVPSLEGEAQRPLVVRWRSVAEKCLQRIYEETVSGEAESVLAVAELARSDESLRGIVDAALGRTVVATDYPKLRSVIESDSTLRMAAIHALASDPFAEVDGVREWLDELWEEGDSADRLAATEVLLARGDLRALERLVTLLEAEEVEVRHRAASRLVGATGERLAFDATGPPESRTAQAAAWRAWVDEFGATAEVRTDVAFPFNRGRTLVAVGDEFVAEYDLAGNETWRTEIRADRCWLSATGERLVDVFSGPVICYSAGDGAAHELWRFDEVQYPCARPLPFGNVLVWTTDNPRIWRLDSRGRKTWEAKIELDGRRMGPLDVHPLASGNTRVLVSKNFRPGTQFIDHAIEIDDLGRVVRHEPWPGKRVTVLETLPDGNDLLRIEGPQHRIGHRIEERDPTGKVVWAYQRAQAIYSAQRLPNGNTLVTSWSPDGPDTDDRDGAEEIRPDGSVAWRLAAPSAKNRYIGWAYRSPDSGGLWKAAKTDNGSRAASSTPREPADEDAAIADLLAVAAAIEDPMRDPNVTLRLLEQLRQPAFVERDPERILRALATAGLARVPDLGGEESRSLVESWRSVVETCLRRISEKPIPGAAEDVLAVAELARSDASLRNAVDEALVNTVVAGDFRRLAELINGDSAVRRVAIHALVSGRLPKVRTRELLDTLWNDGTEEDRLASTEALLARGERDALGRFVTLLDSDDANIRARAARRLWNSTGQFLPFYANSREEQRLEQVAAWRKWVDERGADAEIRTNLRYTQLRGRTLVSSGISDGVFEYDLEGNETWRVEIDDPYECWGWETGERVVQARPELIVYAAGDGPPRELWRLKGIYGAAPMPSGGIFVYLRHGVAEYDRSGKKLWEATVVWKGKKRELLGADVLPNGNIRVLFWEHPKAGAQIPDTALEIDRSGNVIRELPFDPTEKLLERLDNGNAIVRIDDKSAGYSGNRIEERTAKGETVWSYDDPTSIVDAQRLPNGDTVLLGSGTPGAYLGIVVIRPDGSVTSYQKLDHLPFKVHRY